MRELRPVRRCLRGRADSVNSDAGRVAIGVDGRELFEVARELERRFGAIVLEGEGKLLLLLSDKEGE
jgi:hypothetical protein